MDFGLTPEQNPLYQSIGGGISISFSNWLVAIFILALGVFFVLLLKKIIRFIMSQREYFDHAIYLVRLPKEKPEDQKQQEGLERMKEEIARGETIFAAIGGLRAQRGFIPWFIGRNDHFSFEIVAHKKSIAFYVISPRNMSRYLEQQIQAHFPEATMEETGDYNIFNPRGEILAGALKAKREFAFPFKTYRKMEADPINTILNTLSKLDPEDGIAIQYIIRSAHGRWHKKSADIVRKAYETNSVRDALRMSSMPKIFTELGNLIKAAKPQDKNTPKEIKQLTAMEQEMLKGIEEKNSKAGLDVNLRIIVSSNDKARAQIYLNNLANVFNQYSLYEFGNGFGGLNTRSQKKIIRDFIFRRFEPAIGFLLNTEEMNSMYHFPLKDAETPNILWLTAKHAAAPANLPEEGIVLGHNVFRGINKEVRIKREDRRRHMYVIGKSGVGKTVLLNDMIVQDIMNGEGVCVLDPHGDLINDILERIPPERAEDVIVFSPSDLERPLALNLLEFDPKYPEQKTFVINEMIGIFDKLYDLKSTGGPIFEQYMRNAMLLVMSDPESGSTLMEIPKVLSDADFRNMKLNRCKDPTVVAFWRQEAEKAGGDAALANVVPYITSKLTAFISNDMMRPIIGQQKSSFNIRDLMDNQKILLVELTKGIVGEMNAFLLGMILVGKILMSALSRADMRAADRKDFYLYIDEFQNFTTNSICQILSEARKYGLSLTVAHQYVGQLSKNQDNTIRDAVFGNVGTTISFKIGVEDAEFLVKEFNPVFNQFDLINIEKGTAYIKLLVDNSSSRPFSMKTIWPVIGTSRTEIAARIRALSRLKYGSDRNIIEAEIMKRSKEEYD
jgi:hypothetical protein